MIEPNPDSVLGALRNIHTSNEPSSSPVVTPAPTTASNRREEAMRAFITSISFNAIALDNPMSPESQALAWLVNDDPLQLHPLNTSMTNKHRLIQRYALTNVWFSTTDPSTGWVSVDNWFNEDECTWFGIVCGTQDTNDHHNRALRSSPTNNTHTATLHRTAAVPKTEPSSSVRRLQGQDRVSAIIFDDNGLSGHIPPDIALLEGLTNITLSENGLTGTLQTSIANLVNLQGLLITDTQLAGPLDKAIFSKLNNLVELDLHQNQLSGTLPTELGTLTNLRFLTISSTELTGTIPAELGQLTSLTRLILRGSRFTGQIPTELGSLTMLSNLALSYNMLTGTVPTEFLLLVSLQKLFLQANMLRGQVDFLCNSAIGPLGPFRVDLSEISCSCCTCCA